MTPQRDFLLWTLFKQLRDWQFVLDPADYSALHQAVNAGFGWESLTVAFLKALRIYTSTVIWLNPLPPKEDKPCDYLAHTTAAQIARHVPMFPLNRWGLHQAVNVLRGQVYSVESPL
jgi:hypothetical protein